MSGNKQVIEFMDWLYKDSDENLRLERKYNKYIYFKEKYFNKKINDKSPEIRQKITDKTKNTRLKFNGKRHRTFYIKSPDKTIYSSDKFLKFFQKYKLTPCHAGALLNNQRSEYKGWTIPTQQEIELAKNNNKIINEVFDETITSLSKKYSNFYLKSEDNKIYFFKSINHYYKYFSEIKHQSLRLLIRTKKPIRSSKWVYPTDQEIETAKQFNSIITLE